MPKQSFDELRSTINRSLHQCDIIVVGQKLYIRGVFPAKTVGQPPKRTSIKTGCKANLVGLKAAELKARQIDLDLMYDRFSWDNILPAKAPQASIQTFAQAIEAFQQHYWDCRTYTKDAEATFNSNYLTYLRRLPQTDPLSVDLAIAIVREVDPNKSTRKKIVDAFCHFGRFVGWSADSLARLRSLRGSYSNKQIVRYVPTDAEVYQAWQQSFELDELWRLIFQTLAYTGCRPHEILNMQFEGLTENPPYVFVSKGKTGKRQIFVLKAKSWQDMHLEPLSLPPKLKLLSYEAFNKKLTAWFRSKLKVNWPPYGLRHAYARRCYEAGLDVFLASKNMGHSEFIHRATYSTFWEPDVFKTKFQQATQAYYAVDSDGQGP